MPRFVLSFVLLALLAPACGKEIGDPCTTNVDCQQDGTRDCDQSQPGGYCTVNGCDELSCPSEAVCIRVFPTQKSACQQDSDCRSAGMYPADVSGLCRADGICGCDADSGCTSDGLCLPDLPHGFCVPRNSERRYCERGCGSNGDCRGGYVCREAGIEGNTPTSSTYGSVALVANANRSTVVRFCAPGP